MRTAATLSLFLLVTATTVAFGADTPRLMLEDEGLAIQELRPLERHVWVLTLEGKSLLRVFQSNEQPGHDVLCWEHEGHRAVRQGKWKLVATHRGPWEVYDLSEDRTEQNNLAAVHPEKVRELAALYENWSRRCGVVPWSELQAWTRHRSRSAPTQSGVPR